MNDTEFSKPIFSSIAADVIDGLPVKRLMFCYRTSGCAHYNSAKGGCTMCAFPASSTGGTPVPVEMLKKQLISELDRVNWEKENLQELDVFCAGSFFNDDEVPPEVREFTFETAKKLAGIKKVLVESRPEYITEEKISAAIEILGPDIEFEVAIGLESSSSRVRDDIINKGFGLKEFEKALTIIGSTEASLLVYIFLKPPGISEKAAYQDTLATVKYVFKESKEHNITKVTTAIQPAFVQREGYLHDIYVEGNYRPPWLWTVVKLIQEVHTLGEMQIGTSNDYPPPIAVRSNCPLCNDDIEAAIEIFNKTQEVTAFETIECQCKKKWTRETELKL